MRSPLQNRVTPLGDIIATPHRGMFTGNRGIIHDPRTKTLTRRWASRALKWSPAGYRNAPNAIKDAMLLTPPSTLRALSAGYRPVLHKSAMELMA